MGYPSTPPVQPSLTSQLDALQNDLFEGEVARLDAMHRAEQTQALVDRQMDGLRAATQEYAQMGAFPPQG